MLYCAESTATWRSATSLGHHVLCEEVCSGQKHSKAHHVSRDADESLVLQAHSLAADSRQQ